MNLSKTLWTLGSIIGAQQAAKAVRSVEWNDILGVIGLERRPSAFSRALPALGLVAVSAAIGAGAALLLAPSSGEELRSRLSDGLDGVSDRQLAGGDPARTGSAGLFLLAADGGDAERGEQVAQRVGHHGDDRPEQADRRPAQRRPDGDGAPRRGLEPRVGHEQVIRPDQGLEVGAGGRVEGDLGGGGRRGDGQQLPEAEPAEGVRDRDRHHDREPGQVHGDHQWPLAAELDPRPERQRDQRAHGRTHRGQHGHLGGAGPQHQHGDQRERAEPQPGAVRSDGVRGPQPSELPAQGSSGHQAPHLAIPTTRHRPLRSKQGRARGSNTRAAAASGVPASCQPVVRAMPAVRASLLVDGRA